MAYNLTDEEVREFWDRYAAGETAAMLARRFPKGTPATNERIRRSGGIRPTIPCRAERHLTLEEREEISRGLASGLAFREIARRLGRAASTVSREVNNNGGRQLPGRQGRRGRSETSPATEGLQAQNLPTAARCGARPN